MSPESIQQEIRDLRNEIRENTNLTKQGFDTMNGRVKKLELTEATRQGMEQGLKTGSFKIESFWKRVALGIGIFTGILSTASAAAVLVAKLAGILK